MATGACRYRLVTAALVAAAAGAFFFIKLYSGTVDVDAARAERRPLTVTVTATSTGTVKAVTEVKVTARRPGRVSRLAVEEGQRVRQGEIIAEFDRKEAEIELRRAEAALRKMRAALREAEVAIKPLTVEVETRIDKARASLVEAESRYGRYGGLLEKGYVSRHEYESVKRAYEVARAGLEGALSGRGTLKSRGQEVRVRKAALSETRSALELSRLNYSYSFINAPIDGVLAARPLKLGESVPTGGLVALVVAMDSLYIEAFIDEADAGRVTVGQEAVVTMDAFPGKSLTAEIYLISPVVLGGKHEARTFEVRARVQEGGLGGVALRPGMSADVEVVTGRAPDALVVPAEAVFVKDASSYVYVIDGSRAVLTGITTGLTNWSLTEVVTGLSEGDMVVINPEASGVTDGTRVKVR